VTSAALARETWSGPIIHTEDLWRTYQMGSEEIHALRGISFEIQPGEYVAVMGPSGSGKSTLMNLIGCLDTPTKGRYVLRGKVVSEMNDDELAAIRNREIGFVFQTFNLLPRATALHNVELPLVYAGIPKEKRIELAKKSIDMVDLTERMLHRGDHAPLRAAARAGPHHHPGHPRARHRRPRAPHDPHPRRPDRVGRAPQQVGGPRALR